MAAERPGEPPLPLRRCAGGWESLGDHGYVDEDGYLYLGDRMQDMILTGGANVYPAEVSKEELLAFVAEHLARYKVPRSVEFVDHGLRDDAGKVRRSELRRQRVG